MNQILKNAVYGKGTIEQVRFMAKLGGMNEEEQQLFEMLHKGNSDEYIQDILNVSRRTYERIEESVRAKLTIAIFTCINKAYDTMNGTLT